MKFIFDLDGTIVFNGQPMSTQITQCIAELSNSHEVIFASARPIRDMYPVIDPKLRHLTLIGGNGSLISKQGNLIQYEAFDNHTKEKLFKLLEKYECNYIIDGLWDYTCKGQSDHPIICNVDALKLGKNIMMDQHEQVVKILILDCSNYQRVMDELSKLNVTYHIHSSENTIDISPHDVHKASAINKLGISNNSYIAFGNDNNDIQMFKQAKHCIMIGDNKSLLPYADEQINSEFDRELEIIKMINNLQNNTPHQL